MRIRVADEPGVLCTLSCVFAKHGVSLKTVLQLSEAANDGKVCVTFVTHEANELSVQAALAETAKLDVVDEVESVIRVEE